MGVPASCKSSLEPADRPTASKQDAASSAPVTAPPVALRWERIPSVLHSIRLVDSTAYNHNFGIMLGPPNKCFHPDTNPAPLLSLRSGRAGSRVVVSLIALLDLGGLHIPQVQHVVYLALRSGIASAACLTPPPPQYQHLCGEGLAQAVGGANRQQQQQQQQIVPSPHRYPRPTLRPRKCRSCPNP